MDTPPPRGPAGTRSGKRARSPGQPRPSTRTSAPEGHPVLREVRLAVHAVLRRGAGVSGARAPVYRADLGQRRLSHRFQLRCAALGLTVLADKGYGFVGG